MWYSKKQKTKLPNGKRPRYKDLEASLVKVYKQMMTYHEEVQRLTEANAELRHEVLKLKNGTMSDTK